MTERGYCLDKDVLREYSRVNNDRTRGGASSESTDRESASDVSASDGIECRSGEDWRRAWWDRYLGIATDESFDPPPCDPAIEAVGAKREKYAHQTQEMYRHTNPLLRECSRHDGKYQQIWLEIGFGSGDNLLANARNRPDVLFVGSEIHQPGVGTVLRRMEEEMGLGSDTGDGVRVDENELVCDESTTQQAHVRS